MLPSTLKYLYSVERARTHFPAKQPVQMLLHSIAHSIICTRLFRGKMRSDWFNGIKILQGRWQHGEKVGYCYPSGLEKTLCKWDINVPLGTYMFHWGHVCPTGHERVNTSGQCSFVRPSKHNFEYIYGHVWTLKRMYN
jgi:hypothetical protein